MYSKHINDITMILQLCSITYIRYITLQYIYIAFPLHLHYIYIAFTLQLHYIYMTLRYITLQT